MTKHYLTQKVDKRYYKQPMVALESMRVKDMAALTRSLELKDRSKYRTLEALKGFLSGHGIAGVYSSGEAAFKRFKPEGKLFEFYTGKTRDINPKYNIKTMSDALISFEREGFAPELVRSIVNAVGLGYSLLDVIVFPDYPEFGIDKSLIASVIKFREKYYIERNLRKPTRYTSAVLSASLADETTTIVEVDGVEKVKVVPIMTGQSQSALTDVLGSGKKFVLSKKIGDETIFEETNPSNEYAKAVVDCTKLLYMNLFLEAPKENKGELTAHQKRLHDIATKNGIVYEKDGKLVDCERYQASGSQERTVRATYISELSATEALEMLGYDWKAFSKKTDKGTYVVDIKKAMKRFGLSSSSSVLSETIQIGSDVEEVVVDQKQWKYNKKGEKVLAGTKKVKNGDYILRGGNTTMLVTEDIHTIVKVGKYRAYEILQYENTEFLGDEHILDAAEYPIKRVAGDGQFYFGDKLRNRIIAEFGVDISALQARITPFGKGLGIYVPGLEEMFGVDIVAMNSSIKGDYRYSKIARQNIQFRICAFNKPAKQGKKRTLMNYQFTHTLPIKADKFIESVSKDMDRAIELYDSPEKMAEYLGLSALSAYSDMLDAGEELSEAQERKIKNTLTSRFANFLYAGDFTMKDPVMKQYAKDIILNMIKDWAMGSVPVEGAYRFMAEDPFTILATKLAYDKSFANGTHKRYLDEKGDIIIQENVTGAIPANHVVAVDAEDKHFMSGEKLVLQRAPKIDDGETALATTTVTKAFARARAKNPTAFNNLIFFSVYDFLAFMMGGADYDGDKCLVCTEKFVVEACIASGQAIATLDLSFRVIDGKKKFKDGCPFVGKELEAPSLSDFGMVEGTDYVSQDNFVIEFKEEQYNLKLAKAIHDLSKHYSVRALEPNKIGLLTDYATKLLDAIRACAYMLHSGVDTLTGKALTKEDLQYVRDEIAIMKRHVRLIRVVQGWEIDRTKHGGAYEAHVDLGFIENPPFFACVRDSQTGLQVRNKQGNFIWATPDWKVALKGEDAGKGQNQGSVVSRIREFVLSEFNSKVEKPFMEIDPSAEGSNLLSDFATAIALPQFGEYRENPVTRERYELRPVLETAIKQVKAYYTGAIQAAFSTKESKMAALKNANLSEYQKAVYEAEYEAELNDTQNTISLNCNTRMAAIVEEYQVSPEVVGYLAYYITYTEKNKIQSNLKHGHSPTRGLSFPWGAATNQLLAAVAAVSNRRLDGVCRFKEIGDVSFLSRFELAATTSKKEVEALLANRSSVYVWIRPADADPRFLLHHVYAGKTLIGYVYPDHTYTFSGHDKFHVHYSGVDVKEKSAGITVVKVEAIIK